MLRKLDYGCGNGGFLEIQQDNRLERCSWLEKYGNSESYGIDINSDYIEEAKEKIQNGTKFLVVDGKELPFENEYFDIVHESGALHHMNDYKEGISEISRVIKKDGLLLLKEVPTNNKFYNIFRKLSGNWHGDGVESWFSEEELLSRLRENFNVFEVKRYWRSLLSDLIAQIGHEPQISIVYCHVVSKILQFVKLDKYFCCHLVIHAVKK